MVKRISLLVRPKLQKLLEAGDECACGVFLDALQLKDDVLAACLLGGLKEPHQKLGKFLAIGYGEFNDLYEAFRRASRMQCVLGLGSYNDAELKLNMFEKGGLTPVYSFYVSIGLDNGEITKIFASM